MAEEIIQAPGEVTDDDKLWALLSWLFWPIGVIVLLMEEKRQRAFIKYHAVQSLALAVVGWVISAVLSFVIIGCVVAFAWIIYVIYLAIQAYQGEWVTVPGITNFCKNQGWI